MAKLGASFHPNAIHTDTSRNVSQLLLSTETRSAPKYNSDSDYNYYNHLHLSISGGPFNSPPIITSRIT